MVKRNKLFMEFSRRSFFYSFAVPSFLPIFYDYTLDPNSSSNINSGIKNNIESRSPNILSFQLNCKSCNLYNYIETITEKALAKTGSIDLITFPLIDLKFDQKVLHFFKKISSDHDCYVSLDFHHRGDIFKDKEGIFHLVIAPYGEVFYSDYDNLLSIDSYFGRIGIAPSARSLNICDKSFFLRSDIIICNDQNNSKSRLDYILANKIGKDNFLIYMVSFNPLLRKEGISIFGKNNEILSQTINGIDQGIVANLVFSEHQQCDSVLV